jgi:hypothetical protein
MPLLDIHDNVAQEAVVYGGSTSNGLLDISFEVSAVRNSATQYSLNVVFFGSTSVRRMQFFLLLIGNEAAGHLRASTLGISGLIQFTPLTFNRSAAIAL